MLAFWLWLVLPCWWKSQQLYFPLHPFILPSFSCHFYWNSGAENSQQLCFPMPPLMNLSYSYHWCLVLNVGPLWWLSWSSLLFLPLLSKLRCWKFTAALFSNATINEPQLSYSYHWCLVLNVGPLWWLSWSSLLTLPLLSKLRCWKFTAALFSNVTINEPQLFLSLVFGSQCWPSMMTLVVFPLFLATFIETQVLKIHSSFVLVLYSCLLWSPYWLCTLFLCGVPLTVACHFWHCRFSRAYMSTQMSFGFQTIMDLCQTPCVQVPDFSRLWGHVVNLDQSQASLAPSCSYLRV